MKGARQKLPAGTAVSADLAGNKQGVSGVLAPVGAGWPQEPDLRICTRRRHTMINMSRRDFVVSTGLAVALGLNARLAVSPAFAQKTPDPAKPFVNYKV